MWTALFTITIVASIGFAIAAALLTRTQNAAPKRKNRRSLIAELAAGCRDLSGIVSAAFEPRWPASGDPSVLAHNTGEAQLPRLATTVFRDVALLPRRMRLLHIDSLELACAEPLVFRQLAARCGQCHATEQCARDLLDDSTDPFGENWRDYCPNASTLSAISTLRGIGSPLIAMRDSAASSIGENEADTRH